MHTTFNSVKQRLSAPLVLLVGLTACSGEMHLADIGVDAGFAADAETQPDAGVDAGHADLGTRDLGSPDLGPTDSGPPCTASKPCNLSWSTGEPYPLATDHHVSFAVTSTAGSFVYVAGGVTADQLDRFSIVHREVFRAAVGPDGALGSWQAQDDLPTPLGFHALAQSASHTYLLAGISADANGFYLSPAVYIGTTGGNGEVTWRNGARLNQAFGHATAAVLGNKLYIIGGLDGRNPQATALVSALSSNGNNGAWSAVSSLPNPRSHHSAVVYAGHIYLVGGFSTNNVPLQDILRSRHDDDGNLVGWDIAGTMADPPWTHASFVRDGWLYTVGGGQGGRGEEVYVNRVRRARIDMAGDVMTPFEDVQMPLPVERSHVHQTPMIGDQVYSVGGRLLRMGSMNQSYVATMSSP